MNPWLFIAAFCATVVVLPLWVNGVKAMTLPGLPLRRLDRWMNKPRQHYRPLNRDQVFIEYGADVARSLEAPLKWFTGKQVMRVAPGLYYRPLTDEVYELQAYYAWPEWVRKPLLKCVPCMCSVHGAYVAAAFYALMPFCDDWYVGFPLLWVTGALCSLTFAYCLRVVVHGFINLEKSLSRDRY